MHQSTYTVIFLLAIAWHWAFCSQFDNYKVSIESKLLIIFLILAQQPISTKHKFYKTKLHIQSNKSDRHLKQSTCCREQQVSHNLTFSLNASFSYPFNYIKSTALSRQKRQFFGGGSCCMPFQMNPICCPVPFPLPIPQPIPIPLPLPVPMPIPQPIPVGTASFKIVFYSLI